MTVAVWRQVVDQTKGWLEPEEGKLLYESALKSGSGPFMEIGGYCGKSACWLGAAAKEANTVLYSVDHHRGSPEMEAGEDCHDPELIDEISGLHDSLPWFRDTILCAELEPWVIPVVGNSRAVGRWWQTRVSFLFVDGAHDPDGVASDAKLFSEWVTDTIAFHDTTIPHIGTTADGLAGFQFADEAGCLKVYRRC